MHNFFRDLRYSARVLIKSPAFTAVAILSIALGIGANIAIFSVVNAVLVRSLPVKDPQQLVFLSNPNRHGVNGGQETGDRRLFAYHEFEFLRDHSQVFSGVVAVQSTLPTLAVTMDAAGQSEQTERARINMVSGAYFSVLGVNAALGRTFTAEADGVERGNPVAVISYGYWKNRFALDKAILGRRLRIGKTSFEIIGVTQPEFSGETVGFAPDAWVPLTMQAEAHHLAVPKDVTSKQMWLQVMARLKPDVTLSQARASINVTLQQMLQSEASQLPLDQRAGYLNQRIALIDGSRGASTLRNSFEKPLLILMGLTALVLLIACSNVANLFLGRAAGREKETAVRVALGASRKRLTQSFLAESLLIALLGGSLGLLVAQWADVLLLRLVSSEATPVPLDLHLDAGMLAFTLAISSLTGILIGLVPALRAVRVDLNLALKGTSKGTVSGVRQGRRIPIGKTLVVGQVALSLVSLIVAGLLVHSFQKLTHVEPGYDSEHILQFGISPSPDNYQGSADQLHKELLERIRLIPGVRGASLSLTGLFSNIDLGMNISIAGFTPAHGQQMGALNDFVGPNYFSTAGVPILLGREIGPQDEGNAPLVGVINQTMARTYFGDANPIGHQVKASATFGTLDFVVAGVVADSNHDDLRSPIGSWFYTPFFHASRHPNFSWAMNEVRISGNKAAIATAIRAAVKSAAPLLETPEIQSIDELMGRTLTTERMLTQLSSCFGLLALLLACIGLYGVMSYNVAGKTNEIGIRMALGAQAGDVFRLILRQGMLLTAMGVVMGLGGAFALTRLMKTVLFGVTPTDAATFTIVSLALIAVALLACYIPARRATKVDPLVALRYE